MQELKVVRERRTGYGDTRRIREIGEVMGVKVLDHLIFGENTYVSFVEDCYWDQTI